MGVPTALGSDAGAAIASFLCQAIVSETGVFFVWLGVFNGFVFNSRRFSPSASYSCVDVGGEAPCLFHGRRSND